MKSETAFMQTFYGFLYMPQENPYVRKSNNIVPKSLFFGWVTSQFLALWQGFVLVSMFLLEISYLLESP